jgi:hypothetical protein
MMKKLLTAFFAISVLICTANAETLSRSQINDAIWDKIGSDTNLTFGEITKSGQFAGCEVVYRYVYRDYRSRNGEPVILTGSVSSNYMKGKVFGLFLKVQPHVVDLSGKDAQIKSIQPSFATLMVGKSNLDKFRVTKFTCEEGGYCAGYASSNMKQFMEVVFSQLPFNPEILITLTPNGMDSKFRLSDIKQNGKPPNSEMDKFTMCLTKVLDEQIKELEKK